MTDKRKEPKRWERQIGEPVKAFEAFVVFRDLGTERSMDKVSQRIGKSLLLCRHYSSKWEWADRIAAYTDRLDDVKRTAYESEIAEMSRKHAQLGNKMADMALEALDELTPKMLANRPTALANMAELAQRIHNRALGQPAVITKVEQNLNINNSEENKALRQRIISDPTSRELALKLIENLAGEDSDDLIIPEDNVTNIIPSIIEGGSK